MTHKVVIEQLFTEMHKKWTKVPPTILTYRDIHFVNLAQLAESTVSIVGNILCCSGYKYINLDWEAF